MKEHPTYPSGSIPRQLSGKRANEGQKGTYTVLPLGRMILRTSVLIHARNSGPGKLVKLLPRRENTRKPREMGDRDFSQ